MYQCTLAVTSQAAVHLCFAVTSYHMLQARAYVRSSVEELSSNNVAMFFCTELERYAGVKIGAKTLLPV